MRFLVTGATGGIGSVTADTLAAQGHTPLLIGRREDALNSLRSKLSKRHACQAQTLTVDFADEASVNRCSRQIVDEVASLDGLVLIYPRVDKSSDPFPPCSAWQNNFLTAFSRPLELVRAAVSCMGPGGKIVIVSGMASVQVFPQRTMVNAVRAAWLAEAKTLAFVLGRQGIRVNTVSLGGILTDRIAKQAHNSNVDDSPYAMFLREDEMNALGTYGTPEQAATVITQLLTSFSDHLTGNNILCDGGYTRHY